MKKGLTQQAREMWQHLRPWGKRDFWGRQRRADREILEDILKQHGSDAADDADEQMKLKRGE